MKNVMADAFQDIFSKRSAEELRTLAHTKRFLERFIADPAFRRAAEGDREAAVRATRAHGIAIDPAEILPLFHADYISSPCTQIEARWPIAKAWLDYQAELDRCRLLFCSAGNCAENNPRFHAWRQRQIHRVESEIGLEAHILTHPAFAFELSAGCSVGCWFCGFSAERFRKSFPYTSENVTMWRAILEHIVDLFGTASQAGLCYWATDPGDNPEYPDFLRDYHLVTGNLPKTTTAQPLKNLDFTRKVLALSEQHPCQINRFSILTLRTFNEVQSIFSAEELIKVDLVLQNRESLRRIKPVGRARLLMRDEVRSGSEREVSPVAEANRSTLASLSGFLVNMVDRTIRLVTPTRTSERWPLGYRVFGERQFGSAQDFRAAIEDLISTAISLELKNTDVLSFRADLLYETSEDGFALQSVKKRYSLHGFAGAKQLGELISSVE